VNRIVDIIGYIHVYFDEEENSQRILYTRSTPDVVAGSRFKFMKTKIPFGYEELVNALTDAIEEEGRHGAIISNERKAQYIETSEDSITFSELMKKSKELWGRVVEKNLIEDALEIIEKYFGRKMKLSEAEEQQKDLVELVVSDLEDLVGN